MKQKVAIIIAASFVVSLLVTTIISIYGAPPDDSTVIQLPANILAVLAKVHGGFLWVGIMLGIFIALSAITVAVRYGYNKARREQNSYFGW